MMMDEKLQTIIPHRPPMVLIDRMIAFSDDGMVCGKTFLAGEYGEAEGVVLQSALVEALAQTVAAYYGERAFRLGIVAPPGMLVGVNGLRFHRMVNCGEALVLTIKLNRELGPFALADCRITCGEQLLAEGELKFYLEEDSRDDARLA